MKIEYAADPHIYKNSIQNWELEVPVVRLETVDQVLAEAVWAMEQIVAHGIVHPDSAQDVWKAQAFLASPIVTDWRARQQGKPS